MNMKSDYTYLLCSKFVKKEVSGWLLSQSHDCIWPSCYNVIYIAIDKHMRAQIG